MTQKNKPNELYITRIYNAPVEMVWDAWTDPEQVKQWWGPRGFSLTTHSKDLKPGRRWVYTMHGPDGVDYPNNTLYYEVETYRKLVYDHGANENQPALFRVTVFFTEEKGKTKMEMTMSLETPEAAEQIKKFIKQAGGNSTWDRLAEYVDQKTTGIDKFVINRSFKTDVETLYNVWTQPEHIRQWLAPTGFNMTYLNSEIKAGSTVRYYMDGPNGLRMYGRAHYIELKKPEKIVYTQVFTDANDNISRHPHAPTWPETMLTTIELVQEDDQHTRATITWEVYGQATQAEKDTFISARGGMTQGWTGSFDKLEYYLELQNK